MASPFETFILLFKSDSTQLKKDIDEVNKKTRETEETFQNVEKQTKKNDNEFINLTKSLKNLAAAYFSVGAIVGTFKTSMAQTANIGKISREWVVNAESLDLWSRAAKNFGIDSATFQNDLMSLTTTLKRATGDETLAYLPLLADELAKLEPMQAYLYGEEQLNITRGWVDFLRQNGRGGAGLLELIAQQEKLGAVTQEDVQAVRDFNMELGKLEDIFDTLTRNMVTGFLPAITDFVELLTALAFMWSGNEGTIEPSNRFKNRNPKDITPLSPSFKSYLKNNPKVRESTPIYKELWEQEMRRESGNTETPAKPTETKIPSLQDAGPKNIPNQINLPALPMPSYLKPTSHNEFGQIPTTIPQVTNSQSRNLSFDIAINTTSQDAKEIAEQVVTQIEKKENQYWASNSYFDNAVVI